MSLTAPYETALRNLARRTGIMEMQILVVALLSVVFLGERPSAYGWLGIAMIGSGAVLLAVKS